MSRLSKRIILWGIGSDFEKIYAPILEKEINKKNIIVIAEIDKNSKKGRFKKSTLEPCDLSNIQYDYIIITSRKYETDIYDEACRKWGINPLKIVYGRVLEYNDFDFLLYEDKGWINDNWFSNNLSILDFKDVSRQLRFKNIHVELGRKSSIGKTYLDTGGNPSNFEITIGNFTNIAWGGSFELGLNLDHDYNRVMNYGLSHILDDYDMYSESPYRLSIGSDVWIGKNVVLKSGITVGDGAVVASNSVVVKDVPPYAIVGGNPSRVIKYRFREELVKELESIKWWEWEIEKILEYRDLFEKPEDFVQRVNNIN